MTGDEHGPEAVQAMRIALTGARGRRGRAVADLAVAGGHEVLALDRPGAPPAPA